MGEAATEEYTLDVHNNSVFKRVVQLFSRDSYAASTIQFNNGSPYAVRGIGISSKNFLYGFINQNRYCSKQ